MTDAPETSLTGLTDAGLDMILRHAIRNTLVIGILGALVVWKATNWRDAAMLLAGTAVSAASIFEWKRLIRFINAKLDQKQAPRGAAISFVLFVLRLTIFAGVIYGSLKCFRGSVVALLCGLGLAVVAILWEALRLLRN